MNSTVNNSTVLEATSLQVCVTGSKSPAHICTSVSQTTICSLLYTTSNSLWESNESFSNYSA